MRKHAKIAGVMGPATPYKNAQQDEDTQGKMAWQDKLKVARGTNYNYLELTPTMKLTETI